MISLIFCPVRVSISPASSWSLLNLISLGPVSSSSLLSSKGSSLYILRNYSLPALTSSLIPPLSSSSSSSLSVAVVGGVDVVDSGMITGWDYPSTLSVMSRSCFMRSSFLSVYCLKFSSNVFYESSVKPSTGTRIVRVFFDLSNLACPLAELHLYLRFKSR